MVNDFSSKVRQCYKPSRDHGTLRAYVLFFFFVLPCGCFAQESLPSSAEIVIADGTPVKLQFAQTISSAHARQGDRLGFVVVEDVTVGGLTVIRAGTMARGSVVRVNGKRFLGLGGNVVVKLDSVELATGGRVRLQARRKFKGRSHTKLMAAGMLLAGLIYLPAAPVFLLSHGRDCTVLKSTEVTAHIDGDSQVQSADLTKAKRSDSGLKETMAFLPPRVLDGEGREGDMINFVLIANEDDLQRVFARAGWVKVDKMRPTLFWHLLWQQKHYAKLPMKTLYVFGRAQDYSYALPDPAAILTRRHHLRIWKTDQEMKGTPIWVGAATRDVAIEFEKRKLWMIHRIDPDVDAEREFIAGSLMQSHLATQEEYLSSAFPVLQAQTASGEAYHSDSRILLLDFSQGHTPTLAAAQATDRAPEGLPTRIQR
jgi:LssY C-terminus